MQRTEKEPTGIVVFFFLTETSQLAGSFIFVPINLKLSVKVETFLLRRRRYFFLRWGFLEAKNP